MIFKNIFNKKLFSIKQKVVLLPGDGIGPEITQSVLDILNYAKVPLEFEPHSIHTIGQNEDGDLISDFTMSKIREYRYALKGPFTTPIGKGNRSINVTLRKKLKTYANVRPCKSIEGVPNLIHKNVDLVTIRENTEGEYAGIEHEVIPGVCENLKIITKKACEDITKYAFEYAKLHNRKVITCAHKMGVMPKGDGCFIKEARRTSADYPGILYNEEQIDLLAMKLVKDPQSFDIMVMPNLYGDIISDLCAGLIGGLGLTASGNIGRECAVYEAVHGSAPDIAGKGLANPTALLLSATMMLKDMGHMKTGLAIEQSVFKVIKEGKYTTGDIGGKSKTSEYTKAVIDAIEL